MDQPRFQPAVCVYRLPGNEVMEICDAEQGLNLLAEFPIEGEPAMDAALDSCFAATRDPRFTKQAQLDFLKFAKAYGILASDQPKRPAESDFVSPEL